MDSSDITGLRDEIAALRSELSALRSEIAPLTRIRVAANVGFGFIVVVGLLSLAVDRIWDLVIRLIHR